MAVLAFAAAGYAIGATAFAGVTVAGMSAASIGWMAGQIAGTLLFPPKQPGQHHEGPRIGDTRFQSSAYGQMVPIIYGTYPVSGNIIWSTPVREVLNYSTQQVGGKGGGGQQVSTSTYSYFVDLAVLLGEGIIAGVRKIKINGELKYDVSDAAAGSDIAGSTLLAQSIRVYTGTETQTADPLIEAHEGTLAPAYRGYAYMVIEGMDVTQYGGKPPMQIEAEVVKTGTAADLAVVTVATLGPTDGSSGVVLGRAGNIYAGAETSGNEANRWNFYAGSKLSSYVPSTYSYIPVGVTLAGEAIATGSFSGVLTVLHEDGSTTPYTGAFAMQGLGILSTFYAHGIVVDQSGTWWSRGDSVAVTTFFRSTVGVASLTTTQLTGVHCFGLARNACGIAGRVYMHAAATLAGTKHVGYVDTAGNALVLLVPVAVIGGILVSRDGYLWVGPADSVAERKTLRKYDAAGTLILTVDVNNTEALTTGWSAFEDPAGHIWAIGIESGFNRRAYKIHPTTGTLLARSELFIGQLLGFTEDGRSVIWDTVAGQYTLKEIEPLPRLTVGTTALSAIVTDIATRTGHLAAPDLNVATLTDTVRGYAIGRRMSARAALEPLQPAYRWDLIESDDTLKAVKRSGVPVATIDELDLGAHESGGAVPSALVSRRLLETLLPYEVAVQYPDVAAAYEPGTQYARRLVTASRDPMIVEMPMVLSATEAQQLADVILYDRWVSRMVHEISLPRKYARLEPSDVVTVPSDGTVHTLRIVSKRESEGLIQLDCVADAVTVYDPQGVGADLPTPPSGVSVAGPTVLRLLDIPLLRDADNGVGFYAVATGYYDGWSGAELWRSIDAGTSYASTSTTFLDGASIGAALSVLPTFAGNNTFDEAGSVDINVFGPELVSTTSADMLAGGNGGYLGGELIHYRTATVLSAGKYRLSGLLRGRKGTEQYMATHAIGETFVALNVDTVRRVAAESADIGLERLYKAPAFGQAVSEAAPYPFTLAAVGLEPLSPTQLAAGRTANAAWDITIRWTRRARVGAEWRDYVDATLGELTESYEVDIWDSTFASFKRTLTSATQTVTYTSAQQTTDFGSNQTTVYVRVYQLSAVVGRGFPAQGALAV